MGIFSEAVDMERSSDGELARLGWRGAWYTIAPSPLRWYVRRSWWENESRMPPGAGVGAVDVEMWRLQLNQAGQEGILTLDVARYRPAERWRVIKIYAAIDESFKEEPDGA